MFLNTVISLVYNKKLGKFSSSTIFFYVLCISECIFSSRFLDDASQPRSIFLFLISTMAVDMPPHHSHCFNVARAHTATTTKKCFWEINREFKSIDLKHLEMKFIFYTQQKKREI